MGTDINEWMRMKFVDRRTVAVAVNVVRQVVKTLKNHSKTLNRSHWILFVLVTSFVSKLRHENVTVLPASGFLEARKGL